MKNIRKKQLLMLLLVVASKYNKVSRCGRQIVERDHADRGHGRSCKGSRR